LGLGHPECLFLPVPPQDVDVNKPWSALEIDYVKMLSQAELSFSTFTESIQIGSKINIAGTLNDFNGNPLAEQTVILSYLVPGYPTWTPITSTQTDSNGAFSESWIAAATGRFVIKAQWNGNENYASTSTCKNVSVLYDGNENIFSAESNSTLSLLAFNSSSKEISFNVEGPSGTSGYVKFQISKQLMPNMDGVKILIDGKDARCEIISQDKVWVLTFYYSHSTHNIIIKLQGVQIPEFIKAPEFNDFNFLPLIIVFSISVVIIAVGFVYYRRKSNR